jgi:alpha-amylase/alpha-mannosidase (GH57 family)
MGQAKQPDVRVVIHGHFYQPPRESPWTDRVPRQKGAAPFHDWNERITAECYRPNTASRVLDPLGRIRNIVNNFEYMSFNVGPTLLNWLQVQHPEVYARILEADRVSQRTRNGHGNALAQAYNHSILPLCNERDRHTQIHWGLRDFEYRFQRPAQGMWLPETAIDMATAQTLVDHGVRFTILSPLQARRTRQLQDGNWKDVQGGKVDPRRTYRLPMPDGERHLDVFFYDGPVSRGVAFDNLLRSADHFSERLALAVDPARVDPQLLSLAVDGETFGHHSAFGDMCLAAFFTEKARPRGFQTTNYAEFLELSPPRHEVELELGDQGEGSSWSCAHGVGRWIRDCGCSTGGEAGWRQGWREPLRAALDRLRDRTAEMFEERGNELFHDPWRARDDYIEVLLAQREESAIDSFLRRHARATLSDEAHVEALELLEAQRHAMSMYTSCAWFFSDVSGIETVQNLRYAARLIELMQRHTREDLGRVFEADLGAAVSNRHDVTAATLYRDIVLPGVRTSRHAVNARAMFRLLRASRSRPTVFGFAVQELDNGPLQVGGHDAFRGLMHLRELSTDRPETWSWLAVEYASRDLHCFLKPGDPGDHEELGRELQQWPDEMPPDLLGQRLERLYGNPPLGIAELTTEQRKRIAERLAAERVEGLRHHYRAVLDDSEHLLRDYCELHLDPPEELRVPCEFVLQHDVRKAITYLQHPYDGPSTRALFQVLQRAGHLGLSVDLSPLATNLQHILVDEIRLLVEDRDIKRFAAIDNLLRLSEDLQLRIDRSAAEDHTYELLKRYVFPGATRGRARRADSDLSLDFTRRCLQLASRMNFGVDTQVRSPY